MKNYNLVSPKVSKAPPICEMRAVQRQKIKFNGLIEIPFSSTIITKCVHHQQCNVNQQNTHSFKLKF